MGRSDVHAWFTAYDQKQQAHKEGRAALAWLGLLDQGDDEPSTGHDYFDRKVEPVVPAANRNRGEGRSLSKPVDTATRLALLLWAGTIASLAVLFG